MRTGRAGATRLGRWRRGSTRSGYAVDIPSLRAVYRPLKDMRTFVAHAQWLTA